MALVRRDLISPASALVAEDVFHFRHILVRDAAYDSITKTRRAELHEGFADWLLEVAGERVTEQEEIVAYHLEQARAYRLDLGPPDSRTDAIGRRAAAHLASPGLRAADRGDMAAAANLFRRAVAVIPQRDAERVDLLYRFAVAIEWFDVKAALEAFDEARELARKNGDRSAEWRATIGGMRNQMDLDPHLISTEQFREVLQQAGQEFENLDDKRGMATVWNQLASLEWMPCRYAQSDRAARRAIEFARFGDRLDMTTALTLVIASSVFGPSTPEEGLATLEELRDDTSRDLWLESLCIGVEGYHRGMQGNIREARRLFLLSKERLESIGLEALVHTLLQGHGDIELRAGDPVEAERLWRECYNRQRAAGYESQASTQAGYLGSALAVLGRYDEAERYVELALGVAAEDDLASQVAGRSVKAVILAARHELSEAERLSQEALDLSEEVEAPNMRGDTWMDRARVLLAAGETAAAKSAAREALRWYESKGNRPSIVSTSAFIKTFDSSV